MKKLFVCLAFAGLLCGCGGDDPVDPVNPNPGTEQPEKPNPDEPDEPDDPDDPDGSDNQYNPELGDPVSLVGRWELVKTEHYASDGKLLDSSYISSLLPSPVAYIFNEAGIFRYCSLLDSQDCWMSNGFYTYDTDTQQLEMDSYDYSHISVTASYFDHLSDTMIEILYPNIDGLMRLVHEVDESGNRLVEYYYYTSSSSSGLFEKEDLIFIDIPDENFRGYLLRNCDPNGDGRISVSEAAGIGYLSPDSKGIASLEGIEYCPLLGWLYCSNNQLTTLDISKNTGLWVLECFDNQLTSLDVSQHTQLTRLCCYNNRLTKLDVGYAPLYELLCSNNQLTTLDISKNTGLWVLECFDNQLTSLDVSQHTALTGLSCSQNQLTTLDVSQNTALEYLYCSGNQLTTLDVSKCMVQSLDCSNNQLTTLDFGPKTKLVKLDCSNNQLTALDVSKYIGLDGFRKLDCSNNQLTTLDVRHAVGGLYCYNNKLTSLDGNGVNKLYCYDNYLTTLDLSRNTQLKELYGYNNRLTSLDVSNCKQLQKLYLNPMPSLKTLYMAKGQIIDDMSIPETTQIIYK